MDDQESLYLLLMNCQLVPSSFFYWVLCFPFNFCHLFQYWKLVLCNKSCRYIFLSYLFFAFPLPIWKEFPTFPSHLKRRRSPQESEKNSRVVPPFQESPRCVSPFKRNLFSLHCLDVQAEDRLPPRVHVGQPCGKASWERHEGKP